MHPTDCIVVAVDSSPTSLDPRLGIDKASEDFQRLIFNGLLQRDRNDRMVPDLAASWTRVDSRLYRFRLRENVRFHDGRRLEAGDVVYTYRTVLSDQLASPKKAALEAISFVRAVGRDVVEIGLKAPSNGILGNLSMGIIPRGSSAEFASKPIGTGPYRLISFVRDAGALLEAFPGYMDGPPRTRFLSIRVIPDATTRALELKKGGVDLVISATPPDTLGVLSRDPEIAVLAASGNNFTYLGLNLTDPLLKRVEVRQALSCAINREAIIRSLFHGRARLATGIMAPHNWTFVPDLPSYPFCPNCSMRLLDRAGFPDPDGPGPAVRFRLTLKTSTMEFRRVIAAAIQQDLRRVGIGLDVRSFEWGTFFSDVNRGNFQMCILMWVGESDPEILRNVFATGGSRNRGRYSNPQVDTWLEAAGSAESEEEQRRYYELVQRKVAEECPYISLWHEWNTVVMRRDVQGMTLTPDADYRALRNVWRKR